jgi:hypothetical protein
MSPLSVDCWKKQKQRQKQEIQTIERKKGARKFN